jgi:hypothetical protein
LNFIFGIVCLFVCVCAFSLRRESPDMILGDKPLIFEVVLSQPSTSSSILVVAIAGPIDSAPQGSTIDVFFNLDGDYCQIRWQRPQMVRHQCLAAKWYTFLDLSQGPSGGHYKQDIS